MNKTSIEWVRNPDGSQGYTWNPITGCLNNDNGLCKGGGFPCYAYKLANGRLKPLYLANDNIAPLSEGRKWIPMRDISDPFYPHFWEDRLNFDGVKRPHSYTNIGSIKGHKPFGCFVCDMGDLFGIGIPEEWTRRVLNKIGQERYNECRFYLLTKQPQNLPQFSPFPENCWVGVTATDIGRTVNAVANLDSIEAKVKFISFEPLLGHVSLVSPEMNWAEYLDWCIIGACTGSWRDMVALSAKYPELAVIKWGKKWTAQPRIEWVKEIVEAADKAGIPVFEKDNLAPLLRRPLRQELPK